MPADTGSGPWVPQAAAASDPLSARDAWTTLRGYGARRLCREALARFRNADGFSHSRALALQLSLAVIPLVIAVVGLSSTLRTESIGRVLRQTLLSLTPGASDGPFTDAVPAVPSGDAGAGAELALWLGLLFAVAALTTAMGQVQRGANRIYGIDRDRPGLAKYGRALLIAAGAGLPAMAGFLLLVSAADAGDALEAVYSVDDALVSVVGLPLSVALLLGAITVMLRYSPHRTQPRWSWLAVGAALALVLWLLFTGLLAGYVQLSDSFGAVYGPLTGVMALLLWAQLTSVAVFLAFAFTAQLEAARAKTS